MQIETSFTGFADREEGGVRLAGSLTHYFRRPNTIVLGLPRGGVITAAAVARTLGLPMDVLVVRKLSVPGNEEVAMGAIGPGGIRVLNQGVISALRLRDVAIDAVAEKEQQEIDRRLLLYRGRRGPLELTGRTVILVDDGLASGATMLAAIEVVREENPERLVLAVPVAPLDVVRRFVPFLDEMVYLETPDPFRSVGDWYVDFPEVTDDDVVRTLAGVASRELVTA